MKTYSLSIFLCAIISLSAQINPILPTIENTLYIGVNGNDANSGSETDPLATFNEAVNRFDFGLAGNHTHNEVIFLEGTHIISNEIRQACWQHFDGVGYKNISISGIDKETVILDGSTCNVVSGNFIELLGSGISVKNLTIQLANNTDSAQFWAAIDFKGAVTPCDTFETNNVIIENVFIDGCWDHGIHIDDMNTVLVKDCEVKHSNLTNFNGRNDDGSLAGWGSGIKTRLSEDVEIRNCLVHEIWGEGIATARTKNALVTNCEVYDTYSVNIYADNVIGGNYKNNLCHATIGDETYWRGSSPSSGFGIAAEYYPDNDYAESSDVKMFNNIILNAAALFIDDNRPAFEPKIVEFKNLYFCNNTIVGWQGDLQENLRTIRIDFADYNNNLTVMDSIFLFNNILAVAPEYITSTGNAQFISGSPNSLPASMFYGNNYWTTNPEKFSFYNYAFNNINDTINSNIPLQIIASDIIELTPSISNQLIFEGTSFDFIETDYYGSSRNNNFNVGAILPEVTNDIENNKEIKFSVFPNPSSDRIYLSNVSNQFSFKIYNVSGRKINEGETKSNFISIKHLQKGIYFLEIEKNIYKFVIK